MVNYLLRFALS